jgi:hypothetical protein
MSIATLQKRDSHDEWREFNVSYSPLFDVMAWTPEEIEAFQKYVDDILSGVAGGPYKFVPYNGPEFKSA